MIRLILQPARNGLKMVKVALKGRQKLTPEFVQSCQVMSSPHTTIELVPPYSTTKEEQGIMFET